MPSLGPQLVRRSIADALLGQVLTGFGFGAGPGWGDDAQVWGLWNSVRGCGRSFRLESVGKRMVLGSSVAEAAKDSVVKSIRC